MQSSLLGEYMDRVGDPVVAGRILQLRLMMIDRGLSVSEVATRAGYGRTWTSQVLNGRRPSVHIAALDALDTAIHKLSHSSIKEEA